MTLHYRLALLVSSLTLVMASPACGLLRGADDVRPLAGDGSASAEGCIQDLPAYAIARLGTARFRHMAMVNAARAGDRARRLFSAHAKSHALINDRWPMVLLCPAACHLA